MKKAVNICLLLLVTLMVGMASVSAKISVDPKAGYGVECADPEDHGEVATVTCTLTFGITENAEKYNIIPIKFTLTNVTITSMTLEDGWYETHDGDNYVFETTKNSFAVGEHKIATFVATKIEKEQECKVEAGLNGQPSVKDLTCQEFHGVYYDKKGNPVTKEQHDEACVEAPNTGANIPLITLGALLVGGVALIVYGKKNKRFA